MISKSGPLMNLFISNICSDNDSDFFPSCFVIMSLYAWVDAVGASFSICLLSWSSMPARGIFTINLRQMISAPPAMLEGHLSEKYHSAIFSMSCQSTIGHQSCNRRAFSFWQLKVILQHFPSNAMGWQWIYFRFFHLKKYKLSTM